MYTVYMLRTNKGTLYTGQTKDLEARLKKHKAGMGSKYIRSFGSFKLVYKETCKTLSSALKRESEIKNMPKSKKESLIVNPIA